jgi:hypothetical protein
MDEFVAPDMKASIAEMVILRNYNTFFRKGAQSQAPALSCLAST